MQVLTAIHASESRIMANIPAFQASDAGSIPASRTKLCICVVMDTKFGS